MKKEMTSLKGQVDKLVSNHLFDPTNKEMWLGELLNSGLSTEEAKSVYKIAAREYHKIKTERNVQKRKTDLGEVLGFTGATIFTLFIAKWAYIILVFAVIAVLGFVFNL